MGNPERKPGEFEVCGDVCRGVGTCDDGKVHHCCLPYPHKGSKCLCGKCGMDFW